MDYPYRQSTRACPLDELPRMLRDALVEHAEARGLDLSGARVFATFRENPVAGGLMGKLFGRRANPADHNPQSWTALVLLADRVLVGSLGPKSGSSVLSATAASLATNPGLGGLDAHGVSLTGFAVAGGTEGGPGSVFVPLDDSEAGRAARQALQTTLEG